MCWPQALNRQFIVYARKNFRTQKHSSDLWLKASTRSNKRQPVILIGLLNKEVLKEEQRVQTEHGRRMAHELFITGHLIPECNTGQHKKKKIPQSSILNICDLAS